MFIEGQVAIPPYPDWVQSNEALASITVLLARFHAAVAGYDSGRRVHVSDAARLEKLVASVAETHAHTAAVDEVQLLLLIVPVPPGNETGRQHNRVDAEGRDPEFLTHLTKAGAVVHVVKIADRPSVAMRDRHGRS